MLKTTWPRAIFVFFSPIFVFCMVRWLIAEPFVIPSGSMIPTLLINENILVNKTSFGIRSPFWNGFLFRWSAPKNGDIVVFRYPKNPDVFYVKRVIGVPGDDVKLKGNVLTVNGEKVTIQAATDPNDGYRYYREGGTHLVRYHDHEGPDVIIHVPPHEYFMLGDNRDESADSRFWGFVPEENLIGRVSVILFSTELSFFQDFSAAQVLSTIRWSRLLRLP